MNDPVNKPSHYVSHPSGVEAIEITEHLTFNLGNAVKYLMRAPYKGDEITDVRKALWYIRREADRLDREDSSFRSDELWEPLEKTVGTERDRTPLYILLRRLEVDGVQDAASLRVAADLIETWLVGRAPGATSIAHVAALVKP